MKVMQGTVKSAKTANTAIVAVVTRWQHPLYKKYVKSTKKYACHVDSKLKLAEGDLVSIQECRPMSKTKHFLVVEKLAKAERTLKVPKIEEVMAKETAKVVEKAVAEKPKAEVKEAKPKVAKAKKS